MFLNELKIYFKSKLNWLLAALLTFPIILSYVATNAEQAEWAQQLESASPDLNIEKTQKLVEGYNGFSYLFNFLFSSDYLVVFFLIALIGFSCICGIQLYNHKKSGFGNLIISRIEYPIYLNRMILAQIVYIAVYMILYFVLLIVVTNIMFPIKLANNITSILSFNKFSPSMSILILIFQMGLILFLILSITVIIALSDAIINNKYVICFLSIIIYFLPFIICTIVENLSHSLANVLSKLVFDSNLLSIYFYSVTDMSLREAVSNYLSVPIILLITSITLYLFNTSKFKGRYL